MRMYPKKPTEQLEYTVSYANWLTSETISSSVWSVPSGLTVVLSTFTGTTATVWVTGGTTGQVYELVNTITTSSSPARVKQWSIVINMT